MATAVICLIIVIICVLSVRSYTKRVTRGCCNAGGDPVKRVNPKDKNPDHYPYTSEIKVEGMTCSSCARRVENALNSIDGVWAKADSTAGYATVRMKEQLEDEEIRKAVSSAGYGVTGIEKLE